MKKGNLKIRMKERGTMIERLIAKGMQPKQLVINANDNQLLTWMATYYGYNHHRLWRANNYETK